MLEGIDVSEANGPVYWPAVRDSGKRFVYIKADAAFERNLAGANAVGLLTGVYSFPGRGKHDLAALAKRAAATDLRPAVDIEVAMGLSPQGLADQVNDWASACKEAFGKAGVLYGSPAFLRPIGAMLDPGDPALAMLPWFAAYGAAQAPTVAPWGRAVIWQARGNTCWSDGSWGPKPKTPTARVIAGPGRCPGVIGECDIDVFDGTYDDFKVIHGLRVAPLPQ